MDIEWDGEKARLNLRKHGVHFADAEGVLYDSNAISTEEELAEGEQSWVAIGMDHLGRVLVVVHTYRDENIRLISARRSTRRERGVYESGV